MEFYAWLTLAFEQGAASLITAPLKREICSGFCTHRHKNKWLQNILEPKCIQRRNEFVCFRLADLLRL